jgi:hypothetical protein
MFEKGVEVGRIPQVYDDGSVAKGRLRRVDIVKGFELETRYLKSMGKVKAKEGKQEAAKGITDKKAD